MIEAIPLNAASLDATSTGNNTHTGIRVGPNETVAFEMEVTAIGATPTVTWKIQGSMDGTNWFDVAYVTDANDTVAVAARTMTTVSVQIEFLSNPVARRYNWYRLVTTANTNVTYKARAHRITK